MYAITRIADQLELVAGAGQHISPAILQGAALHAVQELRDLNSAPILQQIETLALALAAKPGAADPAAARRIAEMAACLRRETEPPPPRDARPALPWPRLRLVRRSS